MTHTDLINSFNYRIGTADSLSKQPELNSSEIKAIYKTLGACEILANIIERHFDDDSKQNEYRAISEQIINRIR